jgi:uncharacterized protein (DUF58 family)
MRKALGSLTVRGRAFLASGITAIVCGLALLERDLVRVGLLVGALPLVALFFVAGRAHHIKLVREVSPPHLTVGDSASVTVALTNSGAPTGVLLMEEQVPYALGGRPRFVVPPMGRGAHEQLQYTVRPALRGRHRLGPLQLRRREPFGMVEMRQQLPGTAELLVLPTVTPLAGIRLGGGSFATGDDHARSFSVGKVADVVVREYRRGDDLRRVHWRSTARLGELMVRNEEQLWQARAVILLDNRVAAHRGTGPGSSLEAAVAAAASVSVHLAREGYQVRLVTSSGVTDSWHERGRPLDPFPILERLATVQLTDEPNLPTLAMTEDITGGVTFAILGASGPDDHRWWSRFPAHSAASLALSLDVDSWGHRGTEHARTAAPAPGWLVGQGWRTASLARGGSLAATWRELDR